MTDSLSLVRLDPGTLRAGQRSLILVEGRARTGGGEIEVSLGARTATSVRVRDSFYALLELDVALPAGRYDLTASLRVGRQVQAVSRHPVTVEQEPSGPVPALAPATGVAPPRVAVCLATYEPPLDLLRRQVDSIRAQEYGDFICIVSDDRSSDEGWRRVQEVAGGDPRFICTQAGARLGFYRNFERCLGLVPSGIDLVALADQDDFWHRGKLSELVQAIDRTGASLVFSDMNLVAEDGALLAPTYWQGAENNFTDLGALLLTNTVTGASALFRRELLDDVLPFPPQIGGPFHDHWIACVALASGEIAYVDLPLYDYVQHDAKASTRVDSRDGQLGGLDQIAQRLLRAPRTRIRSGFEHASTSYTAEALRVEAFARTLSMRLGARLSREDQRTVRRASNLLQSPGGIPWLVGRSVHDLRGRGPSAGVENNLLKAVLAYRIARLRARLPSI